MLKKTLNETKHKNFFSRTKLKLRHFLLAVEKMVCQKSVKDFFFNGDVNGIVFFTVSL